jgi:ABC-type glycerol-3-phosphate transport system permease component
MQEALVSGEQRTPLVVQVSIPTTLIAAAIAITASPLLLLYIFTQRYIIAGMTSDALKG